MAEVTGSYDLVVIGGGIHGLCIAECAASRGWRTLLLEKGPRLASATTANWFRILHGGLRYLQSADLVRHRESIVARRWFMAGFPDLTGPLPCVMPLSGKGLKRPLVMRMAFALDVFLGGGRNRGVPLRSMLPRGRVIDRQRALRLVPGLGGTEPSAALWYDGTTADSEALLRAVADRARTAGATLLTGQEAVGLEASDGQVTGVVTAGSVPAAYSTPRVVNAAGPWSREVARRLDRDRPELFEPALAFNLLLDRPPLGEGALAVTPDRPDAPALFLQPLRGRLFAGTWYAPWTGPLDDPKVPDAALVAALADLAPFVPGGPLRAGEILDVFPGLLPVEKAGTTDLRSRDIVLDHGADGGPRGLFSVSGVKLTTAPTVAAKVVDALGRR